VSSRRVKSHCCLVILTVLLLSAGSKAQPSAALPKKFDLEKSGPELERRTQLGSFFDVVGRRSAVFGYENRSFEAWVYPLKILDDFNLSFNLQGYPLDIPGSDIAVSINVRPEATVFTYSHSAFTVRQMIFAPLDEPGIVMLLDVKAVLPLTVTASFRPRLRLMWPAGLMTSYVGWDEKNRAYAMTEEMGRFVGMIGSPAGQDISIMPYQEEPRDVPVKFAITASPETMKSHFIPIIIVGSVEGREQARTSYDKLLGSIEALYKENVVHYRQLKDDFTSITTPDERFNTAFEWAKVGVDKGIASNPMLGTGLLAGFRTSGESERPGFAWYFGRDALWTALAITSYGDFASTRAALNFLKKFQRADGKIPHEISQSAALIPWFTDYSYPWASADATPLYIIAHADYWRASGDLAFIKQNWDSIINAYRFTSKTDTDGNGLIENTNFGHGWVEGGALYPPHEEIYMQGLWLEALSDVAELADATDEKGVAEEARAARERTRAATEKTYWLADRGYYAFASALAGNKAATVKLGDTQLIAEDTVLPAVPLWWRTLEDSRAQSEIDHLGGGAIATDWGARIISDRSAFYDPLSYHHGSVWPLFTGWAAMGAYKYGRPGVGYQALMSNALLTYSNALGYVTELLSGDFNSPFGRSSHHQVWSEAMVITAAMRGLLGIQSSAGGRALTFSPQVPANWDRVAARNVPVGDARLEVSVERSNGVETIRIRSQQADGGRPIRITIAPAFPMDAKIKSVTVNGRQAKFESKQLGDTQTVEIAIDFSLAATVVFNYEEGTEVYTEAKAPLTGAANQGLRILRSSAGQNSLRLVVEGLGGRTYSLNARSSRRLGEASGVEIRAAGSREQQLLISFEGPSDTYVRREISIPLLARK
jgi:glycogen debranching enzyme